MSRRFVFLLAVFLTVLGTADAAAQGTRAVAVDAVAMVEKAVAFIKKNGREKAFAEFENRKGPFNSHGLYVVVYDLQGKVLSHGENERMIGKDLIEIRDADGRYFVREGLEMMSKGPDAKGWQDYLALNQVSRKAEAKSMHLSRVSYQTGPKSIYLQRHENLVVGCAIDKS